MVLVSRPPDPLKLAKRILLYAKKTKIKFFVTPRLSVWKSFGLPDLRGFVPHLRQVNFYKDHQHLTNDKALLRKIKAEVASGEAGIGLWTLHDILHIAFYDYALSHMGGDSFADEVRFFENHLASELFSVLVLDYHCLIYTRTEGLAVDLDGTKKNPTLPDYRSKEFGYELFDLYFLGKSKKLSQTWLKKRHWPWLTHEVRYASKQRVYIKMWRDDLQNRKLHPQEIFVEGSQVFEAVWELLDLFCYSSTSEFLKYVSQAKGSPRAFSWARKYNEKSRMPYDFRFTDTLSLSQHEWERTFRASTKLSPSSLFAMWQWLSQQNPDQFENVDLRQIKRLSRLSQLAHSKAIQKVWPNFRRLVLKGRPSRSIQRPQLKAAFFLS